MRLAGGEGTGEVLRALDPKKFALLTSAIAASIAVVGASTAGCTVTSTDDDVDSGSGSSGEPTSSSGGSSGGSSSGGSSSGGSSSGGTSSSSGEIDAGPDGGTCLGDEGAAPSCDNQTGCLTDDLHEDMCTGTASVFRPAVARQIVECLKIAPSCEMGEDESECAQKAVDEACPVDATFVTEVCDNMIELAECVGDEADGFGALCDALVPALTQLGREGLAECVSNFGCTGSPCLDPSYANYSLLPSPPIE